MTDELEAIATAVVDSAMTVHRIMGPGLLEAVYEMVLSHELAERGFHVDRQRPVEVRYRQHVFKEAFRADLVVNESLLVEVKSVEQIHPVHPKQVLTYLRMMKLRLGLLINFGAPFLRDGIKRVAN